MEGPRPLMPGEIPALLKTLDKVFRDGRDDGMGDSFPRFLSAENAANLIVISDGDRIASHVGYMIWDLSISMPKAMPWDMAQRSVHSYDWTICTQAMPLDS